jgi:hypothetical protein
MKQANGAAADRKNDSAEMRERSGVYFGEHF